MAVEPAQVERFRDLVVRHLGLQFEDAKMGWLADVLSRRIECNGVPAEPYLVRLAAGSSRDELGGLAQELTVGETYFFRNIDQFHALRQSVVPERLGAQTTPRALRILSAGCASGEEPYSIAMTLRDAWPDPSRELWIRAVDLNPTMIEKALRARYTPWALRETPPSMQRRWLRPEGRELALDDAIRFAVAFEERNLGKDDPELWRPDSYDVVFCRNVLMYFATQRAQALVARIARSLVPGGYLFLGHAETLRGLSNAFHLRHTHGTFYYQRKDGVAPEAPSTPVQADARDTLGPVFRHEPAGPPQGRIPECAARRYSSERFAEALGLVQALPSESARDPDVLLLHAVLLAHSGQLASAEDACHRLLAIDGLSAGAHYVLALCREGAGDSRGAADHDRAAVYLDPTFAMPRMHLGLLARRAGARETVRQEMAQALALLEREDASRLLLFGGGFNRETLLALCRAELQASGGAALANPQREVP